MQKSPSPCKIIEACSLLTKRRLKRIGGLTLALFVLAPGGVLAHHRPGHSAGGEGDDGATTPCSTELGVSAEDRCVFAVRAFHKPRNWRGIVLLNRDATKRLLAVGPEGAPRAQAFPSWSPDGTSLAYAGMDELWTVDLRTGEASPLVEDGRAPAWNPDPDFNWIAFSGRGDAGLYNTWAHPGPTDPPQEPVQLSQDLDADEFQSSWSPDGLFFATISFSLSGDRRIVIYEMTDGPTAELRFQLGGDFPAEFRGGDDLDWANTRDVLAVNALEDIWCVDLRNPLDPTAVNLTKTPEFNEHHPTWSPNDDQIAFGTGTLWVMDLTYSEGDPDGCPIAERSRTPIFSPSCKRKGEICSVSHPDWFVPGRALN